MTRAAYGRKSWIHDHFGWDHGVAGRQAGRHGIEQGLRGYILIFRQNEKETGPSMGF